MPRSLGVMFREVITHLFRKPATVMYPAEYRKPPERFRGRLIWNTDKCNRCSLCVRDCPCDVLALVPWQDAPEGERKAKDLAAIMERCIYCGQCSWVCPTGAIRFEGVQEMAEVQRQDFRYFVEAGKEESERIVLGSRVSAQAEEAVAANKVARLARPETPPGEAQ